MNCRRCTHLGEMCIRDSSNRESLRDLIVSLEAHTGKLYHLGIDKSVTRSNLSKANEQREYRIFQEYATFMICL